MTTRSGKPLAAIASQGIVAASSLLLQIIAFRELGPGGPGRFALLFGILITVNSVQSGWLGDSLTVLDRFDPGIRRALIRSQLAILVLVFLVTTLSALPISRIDTSTAVLFGLASVAWVFEETLRRLLIARREFNKLVVNDASFAAGSFGLVGFVFLTGGTFTLETLVLALLSGAVVAIAVGVSQLPRIELSRGLLGPSKMQEVAGFGVWRAAQVGLRPGSQALARFAVAFAISYEAVDQLEAARILLAPVLTVVNGAGVYLLPTYSDQAKRGKRFRPAVPLAMSTVAGLAVAYGVFALVFRNPLANLLTDGSIEVTVVALLAWTAFAVGFGAGVPVGNALVARGRSRTAFTVRVVDAGVGVLAAAVFALLGWVDAVPFGLAAGTAIGAVLLLRRLHEDSSTPQPLTAPPVGTPAAPLPAPSAAAVPTSIVADTSAPPPASGQMFGDISSMQPASDAFEWQPAATPAGVVTPIGLRTEHTPLEADSGIRRVPRAKQIDRWLWLVPLLAIVATEYKFRRRAIDDALGGSIDLMIIAELGVYGLIGVWALWRLAPTKPRLTPLTVIMWGYILTTAVSAIYSAFPLLALARSVQLLILGAVVHVIATDGRIHHLTKLVHAWIVLLTFSILVGLAYVAPTTGPQVGRFTWLYVHSVSAGSMLALSVPMLFGLWLSSGRRGNPVTLPWARWVYGSLLAVHVVFLLATRTRGSIGGCFIAIALMAWIWTGQKAKSQLVLGSLVAGGASLLAFGGPVLAFLTRGESAEKIGTFNRRTEIWSLAWESFMERPLHGLGFTSAKGVFFDETGLGGAHNALINVMIDVGLAGLIWWTALLVGVGVGIHRLGAASRSGRLTGGSIGSAGADHLVLVGMFTSSIINSVTTEGLGAGVNVSAIWLYLMVAWICVLRRDGVPAPVIADATSIPADAVDA